MTVKYQHMTRLYKGVVLTVAVFTAFYNVAGASQQATSAHRLLQAEYQGRIIGSKHYSAEGYLSLPLADGTPFKAIMVLPVNTTTPETLEGYIQQNPSMSGVLLMQPKGWDSAALPAQDAANLIRLEQQLFAARPVVPVFFAQETAALAEAVAGTRAMFERGAPPTKHTDRYEVAVQGKLPSQIAAKQALNYVASLRATDDQFKPGVAVAPTLLLTAHYDAFSIAPAAPAGADAAGSGAAACLLLLRLLHRLYASPETRPNRNIMVVLTSGGPYGQQGLRQWINELDPAHLEALQGAIVFDSIGGSTAVQQQQQQQQQGAEGTAVQDQKLHLHHAGESVSSTSGTASWADAVAAAAKRMGVAVAPVETQLSSADADTTHASLGHEHLAQKGVAAVSLSYISAPPAQRLRVSSLADTAAGVSLDRVIDAAQVAADAVVRWLYPHLDAQLRLLDLRGQAQQHKDFLAGWIGLLSTATNMMPLDKVDPTGSSLHDNLQQFMRAHSHATKRHVWHPAGTPAAITVWTGTTATLRVYKAAGFMLDMVLLASTVVYLGSLWLVLAVATRGWKGLAAMLQPKPVSRRGSRSNSSRRSYH